MIIKCSLHQSYICTGIDQNTQAYFSSPILLLHNTVIQHLLSRHGMAPFKDTGKSTQLQVRYNKKSVKDEDDYDAYIC